jgi:arsenical pump membrane protein
LIPALQQCWPPFVLVTGLLLIGLIAGRDGLFEAAAGHLERLPGPPVVLFIACCLVVSVTTALLNLDTSAVFLTPVVIVAGRRRGLAVAPFLYAALLMCNASSLYLPGSNLTNLLVLSDHGLSGGAFLARMWPAALSATVVTALGLLLIHRNALRGGGGPEGSSPPPLRIGLGLACVVAAAVLMVLLKNAALPVLAIGVMATALRAREGAIAPREALRHLGALLLLGLFVLAVCLGALARATGFPGEAVSSASPLAIASLAAGASVLINNLPAAVLLSAAHAAHPRALLIGLDIGPNLAISGSLSALLWWRAAKASGARPSAVACSRQGVMLAPIAIVAALAAAGMLQL